MVPALVDITNVAVIGDHRLRLSFEDGTMGDVASYCQMLWMTWRENAQTATFSSIVSLVSLLMTLMPSLNVAPSKTSATSSWPLKRRQRSWAASSSL